MKPRRVVLTVEVETNLPLAALRDYSKVTVRVVHGGFPYSVPAHQISANVIRDEKKRKGKR